MTKRLVLSAAILSTALLASGATTAFAAGDTAVQGRPMGGLAMSERDQHAIEAASMDRKKPSKMQKRKMLKRHMKHNAM